MVDESLKKSQLNSPILVDLESYIPSAWFEIRYATTNNFTKNKIYPYARCFLVGKAVGALLGAVQDFQELGYTIKIWDAYRPLSVQRVFWDIVPDERYVANPTYGSRHNRGCAIDLTLVNSCGQEVDMGTGFDDFTPKAHRDYANLDQAIVHNRHILQSIMERHNFLGWPHEWWHFDFKDFEQYPILDIPFEDIIRGECRHV